MPIEHINKTDTLNEGREKINEAIDGANAADVTSKEADTKATQALAISESTQTQLDTIVIDGDSSVEAAQARVDEKGEPHPTLKARIDDGMNSVNQQLAETMSISAPVASAFWKPPTQPTARPDEDGYFESAFTLTSDRLINNHYEPMRNDYPDYIKRINKGKDESGDYDWYRYEFTPIDYEKTIILGSGMHGPEAGSVLGLYLFLKEVVYNWKQHPTLSYIRHKVRLIVMPTQNPWGMSQNPRVRQNSNGVDINRNFGYKWEYYADKEPFDHDYKGSAPFSEVESRYIKETLEAYWDAIAYLDFHNMVTPRANYVLYTPKYLDSPKNLYVELIEQLKGQSSSQTVKWGEMDNPTGFNYAADRFGMHSASPEFGDGIWGRMYDSTEMTKYVEWIGNIVIQHSKLDLKATANNISEPFTVRGYYRHGVPPQISIPYEDPDEYKELEDLRLTFDIPSEGILQVHGEVVVLGTSSVLPDTITFILPMVGQKIKDKGSSVDFNPFDKKDRMWEVYAQGADRKTIPFSADVPVYPTSLDIGPAIVGLYARSTTGTVIIQRYRVSATFIPSQKGERVRIFNATGNGGQGAGAMDKEFPGSGKGYDI